MTISSLKEGSAVGVRSSPPAHSPSPRDQLTGVGSALRKHRAARGLSLRQLARDLGVSASFISQLENGKSQPSVATLFAICEVLDVTVDQVFNESAVSPSPADDAIMGDGGRPTGPRSGRDRLDPTSLVPDPVVRAEHRRKLVLDTGVTWERLGHAQDAPGEFLLITYAVGGSSIAGEELSRHNGTDYVFVVSGELTLTLGFETYTLGTNDSVAFDSSIPHRLRNDGTQPAQAVCYILGDSSTFATVHQVPAASAFRPMSASPVRA